ncbi:MAG: alpha/beta hydrolase [Devosia nanyangense]|uniref:Alpha/beta hydrolase n=1 Tax=Devosia nanyangense TaxID=1228055 RepID=A0A933L1U3_9HYPH|nr:alpha/beta hydrolase [Devosia nanyangense]
MATRTVVFIHGAWMAPTSWDGFKGAFGAAGYRTLTPAWPLMDRPVAELRASPHPDFGRLGVGEIADHHEALIRSLPEKPLLVGHSFGGLIVQMLLDRGIGAAGIAFDPAPIAGVTADPTSLGAALPAVLRWNGWNTPFMLSREGFANRFANTVPAADLGGYYDRLVVPAPGRIFYQAALMSGTGIRPARRNAPLLITSADKDRTVAPPLARQAYAIQRASPARTDFKTLADRSHFLCVEKGWEEVAKAALDWAADIAK